MIFSKILNKIGGEINILERPDVQRNESFGVKLLSVWPEAAKLSKKDFVMVNIVTDAEAKKR